VAAGVKFQQYVEDLAKGVHNLSTGALKVMLTLVAPVNTNTVKANLTEIAAGNGYTAGGSAVTITTAAQAAGTFTLAGNQVVFTAGPAAMDPFRYVTLYNDTPAAPADPLIQFWDYGSTLTLNIGETFTIAFNNTNPGTIQTIA